MISGHWFQRKISKNLKKKLHQITNNSIRNRGSTLVLNKYGRGLAQKKHTLQEIRTSV